MGMHLSDNIRACRKGLGLTQEQLAEAVGVTVGAVYKWEAGLSVPELALMISLADFFDMSLDALVGYELRDNRREAAAQRILDCLRAKDASGLDEAERALKKYPYAFEIVYRSAGLYQVIGLERRDKAMLRRSAALYEAARPLLSQNSDPKIGDVSLSGDIAQVLMALGEEERGLEMLRQNNVGGLFSDRIGLALAADAARFEQAAIPLSEALVGTMVSLTRVVFGLINVYFKRGEEKSALELLPWAIGVFSGLRDGQRSSFFDKTVCLLEACLARAQLKLGQGKAARQSLRAARSLASAFDAAPDYRMKSLRFVSGGLGETAHDDIGETALAGLEKLIGEFGEKALSALWEEVKGDETRNA